MPAPGENWNQFELVKTLGSGGMGEVFLAEDKKLDRKVALKFLPESLRESTTARERFFREAKSAARLDHPYICKIFEVGDVKGTPYLAMEYVEGTTLKDRLKAGRMHLPAILQIGSEIAEAVDAAHRKQVVHRDLKPANIMVTLDGHVKVTDFGLAKQINPADDSQADTFPGKLTSEGETPGTVSYMSPEQVRGEPLDARSDVFSLTATLSSEDSSTVSTRMSLPIRPYLWLGAPLSKPSVSTMPLPRRMLRSASSVPSTGSGKRRRTSTSGPLPSIPIIAELRRRMGLR